MDCPCLPPTLDHDIRADGISLCSSWDCLRTVAGSHVPGSIRMPAPTVPPESSLA